HGLSLASGETMDQVYDCLCVLEQEYIEYKIANELRKRVLLQSFKSTIK
ncbi:type III secretion system protein PrgN, partial [Enterococcus faecium]